MSQIAENMGGERVCSYQVPATYLQIDGNYSHTNQGAEQ